MSNILPYKNDYNLPTKLTHQYFLIEHGTKSRLELLINCLEAIRNRFSLLDEIHDKRPYTILVFFRTWHPYILDLLKELKVRNFITSTMSLTSSRIERRKSLSTTCNVILSCGDILSRGIDLPQLTHVINYDFPRGNFKQVINTYIHRAGRVGRLNAIRSKHKASNIIINFISLGRELKRYQKLLHKLNIESDQLTFCNQKMSIKKKKKKKKI